MQNIKKKLPRIIGIAGTLASVGVFAVEPSFPTPDKLVVFLAFVFMIFGQASQMLKRLLPFVAVILAYESFRGIVPHLNNHVNYTLAPAIDKWLFGGKLPTARLQDWLWQGHTSWYDIALYIPYMLFFVVPLGLALLVWKTRDSHYWQVVWTYTVVFFGGFLTFLAFPAAPPWLAVQNGYIEPIVRVSSNVWFSLGIRDFPSLYSQIAPNPVAAIPSLHSAVSTLFSLFIFKLYGKRWGMVSLIYPAMIYVGVVYEGEHYVFDVIVGVSYAFIAFWATPKLLRLVRRQFAKS